METLPAPVLWPFWVSSSLLLHALQLSLLVPHREMDLDGGLPLIVAEAKLAASVVDGTGCIGIGVGGRVEVGEW